MLAEHLERESGLLMYIKMEQSCPYLGRRGLGE